LAESSSIGMPLAEVSQHENSKFENGQYLDIHHRAKR
jgi:hypothetical protein